MGYGDLPASPHSGSDLLLVLLPGTHVLSVSLPPLHPRLPGRLRDTLHSPKEGLGIRPGAESGLWPKVTTYWLLHYFRPFPTLMC